MVPASTRPLSSGTHRLPGEAQIKGGVLLARLHFLRTLGGEELANKVVAALPPADAEVLRGIVLPVVWYSLELNQRLDLAIADVAFKGDRQLAFLEMGRASAQANLTGPHAMFVRKGDPHHLLSQARVIYRHYYAVGHREYERTGEKSATLRTFDAETVTATDCLTVIGWHQRAIELSGGQNVAVQHPRCRAAGAELCEYQCSWS